MKSAAKKSDGFALTHSKTWRTSGGMSVAERLIVSATSPSGAMSVLTSDATTAYTSAPIMPERNPVQAPRPIVIGVGSRC